MHNNDDVANFTSQLYNDGVHDTLTNLTIEFKDVVQKITMIVSLKIAEDENDTVFRRELFKGTMDVEKLLKGNFGSFFMKIFMENYFKSIDFEPKLPFKKVNLLNNIFRLKFINLTLQGFYRFINFSVSDNYFPFPLTARGLVEIRQIGKIAGRKTFVHLFTTKVFGMIQKL